MRAARLDLHRGRVPSLDEVEEARTNVFFERIRATLEARDFKPHDRMIDRLLDQGYSSTDICSALIHLLRAGAAPEPTPSLKPILRFRPSYPCTSRGVLAMSTTEKQKKDKVL